MKPVAFALLTAVCLCGAPAALRIEPPAATVDVHDFAEAVLRLDRPDAANCFADVTLRGEFTLAGARPVAVDGFCDAADGSVFRIRFMPVRPGDYTYALQFRQREYSQSFTGVFRAKASARRGLIQVDPQSPWHFLWTGTGEHYFYNGTTAYFLAGLSGDKMHAALDRLASLKTNRVRAALSARVADSRVWFEGVMPSEDFTFLLSPWICARPASVDDPGIDPTRFNVEYWHHWENLLRYARERDIAVSVIFYLDGYRPGVDPFGKTGMGNAAEQMYYRYASARLGAFSNVMWDLSNEYRLFRNDAWAEKMGAFLRSVDPYHHLMSVHGHGDFRFYNAAWADFAMFQMWDESGGHATFLRLRHEEQRAGRPMPLVNEEYGYEDTYPAGWGGSKGPPSRSAETRRRLAWGMYMAGAYQTTGERAGMEGGWVNGWGDRSMTMLQGYSHIVEFFSRFPWWQAEPHDELASAGAWCLAKPGEIYAAYLPEGGGLQLKLEPGVYRVRRFNPRSGEWKELPPTDARQPNIYVSSDPGDWAVLLERQN